MTNKDMLDGNREQGHGDGITPNIGSHCRCPNCGHREPSQVTVPCYHRKCPKCGAPMAEA